jgi:uncharacterized protein YjbI with pentapeptide repeats
MDLLSWVLEQLRLATSAIYLGIGLLVVMLLATWWWVPKRQVNRLRLIVYDPKANADVEDNFRKTLGQLFGGIAVLLGAAFAYYQFKQTISEAVNTRQISERTLISQQVSKGFEQLASKKELMLRLGGIYELEGVMNESPEYHRPIIEALCAFVRDSRKAKPDTTVVADIVAALTVLGRRHTLEEVGVVPADLAGIRLSGLLLSHVKLAGIDLSNADLTQTALSGADLTGTILAGATLTGATLTKATLTETTLTEANLSEAHLEQANLSNAHLEGANMNGAILSGTSLVAAHLDNVDLSQATLSGAQLLGATLTGATLIKAKLPAAVLRGATLTGAKLIGADLAGADLAGANLAGADLSGANLFGAIVSQPALNSACGSADTKLSPPLVVPQC